MATIMLVPFSRLVGNPFCNVTKPNFSDNKSFKMEVSFENSNYSTKKESELVNKQHRVFFSIYAKHYKKMPNFKFTNRSDYDAEFSFDWNTECGDVINVKYILKDNTITLKIFPNSISSFDTATNVIPQIIKEFKTHKWIDDDSFYGIGRKALTSEWERAWYEKYEFLKENKIEDIIDKLDM